MRSIKFALIVFTVLPGVATADPGFVVSPTGQATGSTCQSYALGVALAFKRDAAFKLSTAAELRNAELSIRAAIKKAAGASPVNHDHVRAGFESYTNGAYLLRFRDVELGQIGEDAKSRSGVTAPVPLHFVLGSIVKDVILASATKIDEDSYSSGHIFAILGADGPPNSDQRLLILNSAIKVKDTERNSCLSGVPDDPGPYTAALGWKAFNKITFKTSGDGKVRLWVIEKKAA
jgi:hypothetical protein